MAMVSVLRGRKQIDKKCFKKAPMPNYQSIFEAIYTGHDTSM